jgi:hypothetical protein
VPAVVPLPPTSIDSVVPRTTNGRVLRSCGLAAERDELAVLSLRCRHLRDAGIFAALGEIE